MQEKIGKVLLDYESYPGKDLYSDGDIEDELLSIAKEYGEEEFDRVVAERKSWPVLYHFSHVRTNILQWIPMTGQEEVLEIGSGCGAITGALAEKAKAVTCIDLSKKRSYVNAYRNQNRDNIQILVGNFQDIEKRLTKTYDMITLIGVFEYAQGYIGTRDPYVDFLKKIGRRLAPGGRIVLAIENRLGMKYWAGAAEDHVGTFFEGIEGYPDTQYARTFSRPELNQIMEKAGFSDYTYYYPYPDYKLPMTVYSDERLPQVGELNQNRNNFDRARISLFHEERAFDTMIRAGLFPLYSNSYLVMLKKGEETKEDVCYTKYSNERAKEFRIRTDICREREGNWQVEKLPMGEEARAHVDGLMEKQSRLTELFEETPLSVNRCEKTKEGVRLEYLTGRSLEALLDQDLEERNLEEMKKRMKKYFAPLLSHKRLAKFARTEAFDRVFGGQPGLEEMDALPVADIDMVFSNVFESEKGWQLIDYEWTFFFPIPVKFLIYRCLFYYIRGNAKRLWLEREDLYGYFGISCEEQKLFAGMEQAFQRYILGGHTPIRLLYEDISEGVTEMGPVIRKACEDRRKRRLQVFYNYGNGYREADSRSFPIEEGPVKLDIPVPAGVKSMRIDPCSESCLLHLRRLEGERGPLTFTANGICISEGLFAFETEDPQLLIPHIQEGMRIVRMEYQAQFLTGLALDVVLSQNNTIQNSREKIRQMEGTRAWKLNEKLRKLTGRR